VRIEDVEGCFSEADITVGEPEQLLVDAGADQLISLGEDADLRAVSSALPVTYTWTPSEVLSCGDCSSPIAFPFNTTTFQVLIEDPTGCTATDEVLVSVAKLRELYIPNAFSPNGDGDNDYFTLYGGPSVERIQTLRVFDRWGNQVYEGEDIPPGTEGEVLGWDGTFRGREMRSAVFTWMAEVRFIDQEVLTYKGDLTLLR
jgi:gliding motility-associated-like protein